MKSRSFISMAIVAGLVAGASLLLARFSPPNAEAAAKAKAASPAAPQEMPAPASAQPKGQSAGITTAVVPAGAVTLRLTFRPKPAPAQEKGTAGSKWDGSLTLSNGRIGAISTLRKDRTSSAEGNKWSVQNMRKQPQGTAERKKGAQNMPFQDTGVIVNLTGVDPSTRGDVKTVQGDFSFQLSEVPMGAPKSFLNGLAKVELLPNSAIVVSAPTEDDFAAAAYSPDGTLYAAYVAFTHGKDFAVRAGQDDDLDLAKLNEPTGGDRIFLMRLDGGHWTGPLPVTPPNQDVFRPAIAIDGTGRVWVFWTAKAGEQWDLFARSLKGDSWGEQIRLTNDPGPDVFPAAARDAEGKVWVAWQAFRTTNSDILAMRQEGGKFGAPMVVSENKANEWTPAIAANKNGDVAIVWDTYAKGDYDVFARVWSKGQLGDTVPIATTLRAEMRPTATYDNSGRLWIAYEDSPEKWGKDWGGLKKEGVRLYMQRRASVRVLAGGQLLEPADPTEALVKGAPAAKGSRPAKVAPVNTEQLATAKEKFAEAKRTEAVGGPSLAAPRLACDASGRIWLAVRSPAADRTNAGSVWTEWVTSYDGEKWSGAISCPNTDNILDNRPALAPRPSGGIALVTSSDGRTALVGAPGPKRPSADKGKAPEAAQPKSKWPDPVNNEIAMVVFDPIAAAPGEAQLRPVPATPPTPSSPEEIKEAQDIARMRAEKITVAGKPVQIFRGDFHRHTEISGDGGGDGMLMDMWRYALDAANMDWIGNGDHDNGGGREYSWWMTQKTTDLFTIPGVFTPMFTYERSVTYPDGHRNVVWAKRGVRTLPRMKDGMGKNMDDQPGAERPNSPDTLRLYKYLKMFDGVCASHTSATDMGTDWRDNDPIYEPIVEIYQGCRQNYEMPGAPRSPTADFSIGGWRPLGFINLALAKGYKLGFQSSSDHGSVHMSYCNVWVEAPTREAILEGMKRRHIYGSTTNIIGACSSGEHFMGDEFTTKEKPTLKIHIAGAGPMAKVHIIKDGKYALSKDYSQPEVSLEWTDMDVAPGKTSYYYVRGEQADGELVWLSPMWITYKP